MSDTTLRDLERAASLGDESAKEAFLVTNRREGIDLGLSRWIRLLNERIAEHYRDGKIHGDPVAIDPRGKAFIRIVRMRTRTDGTLEPESVYCFVERATGNILKPGGWKGPEPKRIIRGNIYAWDCLAGCGPHGVAYVSDAHGNYGWNLRDGKTARIVATDHARRA